LVKCQFTDKYYDYESKAWVYNYNCPDEEILDSGLCIFHDENYLKEGKDNRKEHEQKVIAKLMEKVRNSINQKEKLLCIGYHLPDITIKEANFTKPVYFSECKFQGKADFIGASFQAQADFGFAEFSGLAIFGSATFSSGANFSSAIFSGQAEFFNAKFSGLAYFSSATFSGQIASFNNATFFEQASFSNANFKEITYFSGAIFLKVTDFNLAAFFDRTYFSDRSPVLGTFNEETRFNYVLFEAKERIIFEVQDLSKVSFMNSDITRVRFSDKARWAEEGRGGGKKHKKKIQSN
jgi:hypothetical protein